MMPVMLVASFFEVVGWVLIILFVVIPLALLWIYAVTDLFVAPGQRWVISVTKGGSRRAPARTPPRASSRGGQGSSGRKEPDRIPRRNLR